MSNLLEKQENSSSHSPLNICKFQKYDYEIIEARMEMKIEDGEIWLSPSFTAEYENEKDEIDYEVSGVYLYFNGYFNTKVKDINALKGCKFQCDSQMPDNGDIALIYVVEHEDINNAVLEILDVTEEYIEFNWTGKGDVHWDEDFYTDVPFNATARGKIMLCKAK